MLRDFQACNQSHFNLPSHLQHLSQLVSRLTSAIERALPYMAIPDAVLRRRTGPRAFRCGVIQAMDRFAFLFFPFILNLYVAQDR